MLDTETNNIVTLNIMGRDFRIKCPEEKVVELQDAANYLQDKMLAIKGDDNHVPIDRIAIAAALNIANELLGNKAPSISFDMHRLNKRLLTLQQKLDKALEQK